VLCQTYGYLPVLTALQPLTQPKPKPKPSKDVKQAERSTQSDKHVAGLELGVPNPNPMTGCCYYVAGLELGVPNPNPMTGCCYYVAGLELGVPNQNPMTGCGYANPNPARV